MSTPSRDPDRARARELRPSSREATRNDLSRVGHRTPAVRGLGSSSCFWASSPTAPARHHESRDLVGTVTGIRKSLASGHDHTARGVADDVIRH